MIAAAISQHARATGTSRKSIPRALVTASGVNGSGVADLDGNASVPADPWDRRNAGDVDFLEGNGIAHCLELRRSDPSNL